ncbi:hypothetical protein Q7P37_010011 [Cladosporium fusiforme]
MPARPVSRFCAPALVHAAAAACEPAATSRALAFRTTTLQSSHQQRSLSSHATLTPIIYPCTIHKQQHQQQQTRPASSSSSARWKTRQTSDHYTKSSKLTALKSRAAYKLLEINDKHKLFRAGQSVVDLGYAPGSWSQVAKNRVGETGRVVGIDVIPAQPPRGGLVREFVREWKGGGRGVEVEEEEGGEGRSVVERARGRGSAVAVVQEEDGAGVESAREEEASTDKGKKKDNGSKKLSARALDLQQGRVVDVVLSDMCAPFPGLELSSWINSVNRPYRRMMNTSGNPFRDHAGSIDLCMAALTFSHDCLVTGGHFLCKFYQGPEDKDLENRMKRLFEKVYRIKPDSSRKESRESYFVGLRRKADVSKEEALR